jgi:hypothetical protein
VNVDGSPANLSWATPIPLDPNGCYFKFNPTSSSQEGSRVVRIKAVTDTRGTALSEPFDLLVKPQASEPIAFLTQPGAAYAVVGADSDGQRISVPLDTSGTPWGSLTCSLVNLDGSQANFGWAYSINNKNDCTFVVDPKLPEHAKVYDLRVKASTDNRGFVLSNPFKLTVTTN